MIQTRPPETETLLRFRQVAVFEGFMFNSRLWRLGDMIFIEQVVNGLPFPRRPRNRRLIVPGLIHRFEGGCMRSTHVQTVGPDGLKETIIDARVIKWLKQSGVGFQERVTRYDPRTGKSTTHPKVRRR